MGSFQMVTTRDEDAIGTLRDGTACRGGEMRVDMGLHEPGQLANSSTKKGRIGLRKGALNDTTRSPDCRPVVYENDKRMLFKISFVRQQC